MKEFAEAYGVEKSATSGHFIQASRQKLQELLERPLGQLRLCALVIDGTPLRTPTWWWCWASAATGRKRCWD